MQNTEAQAKCFLGVESSLSGKRWVVKESDERAALALAQKIGVPEIIGRVLSARGVGLDEAAHFLNPSLKSTLPDPSHLLDMEEGAERLASAVMQGEKIAIFGDYDVDGATSSALLFRFFTAVGAKVQIYIPDRMKEGYGPNEAALIALRDQGASVVVTVDCGTTSFVPLKAASDCGLDVIVVDHHKAEPKLPTANAIINPNRLDEDSPHTQLAAVGVTFLLVVAVNRALRKAGWYKDGRPEPDLMRWLDLVALGTVCDVVPLIGINRALVMQGLKVMAFRTNPGLAALADVAGVDEVPGAYHAGYILGPRINAGGRVGESGLGARLLSTDDGIEAKRIAEQLHAFNLERQAIEATVLLQAEEQVETAGETGAPVVFAAGEGWHPGVIGIVASRLKEKFNRPSCVVSLNGETGTGSGRSISGFDLGSAVIAARQAGHLDKGGGHAMAAGFTVARDRLPQFRNFLIERMIAAMPNPSMPNLALDGALKVAGATTHLAQTLEQVGPFGVGNPEPRFAIAAARLAYAEPVGRDQAHLRCTLSSEDGSRLNAIAFRVMESDLGQALVRHDGAPFHFAGRLRLNHWQGRTSAQLLIEDAAPVW
ncbi:MAG: single-stranded-DNA-specific exonuclease RecJ [Rhodospirillales bacterium]|nr:single-stranded-DNA-specific exonuclease RecJ [Rhodospirillales bacterium]